MKTLFSKKLLSAVTVNEIDTVRRLTETYLRNGLNIMEVTFRTDITVKAIQVICNEFPEFIIGAGTILTPEQVSLAVNAGARFGLSPGFNKNVVKAAKELDFPFIPGVATPSEVEQALEMDCQILKFFPAEPMGGIDILKVLSSPYKHTGVKFIPMGGINEGNMEDYLRMDNVIAVGGSWLAPKELIESRHFDKISDLVKKSISLVPN